MGGLGDAAGAADVNTIVPVSEVATGLRRPLGPGGFMELSQAELSQAAGVNHVSACGFTSGLPVATGRKCLHRPVTSERALRAGPVADVPYICNNGRGGAVDGRQPFLDGRQPLLPVGATAVNSGLQRGRGHSRSGAVAASLSCFSCSAVWELAAAWVSGPDKLIRRGPGVGVLRNASALCWTPCERGCERGAVSVGCVQRGFSTSACTWAPVVTGRSGRQPLRIRGLTAGREFQAWLSRESLHWGDGRTGLPGSSSMAWTCSPSSGAAPPPSGSGRPGCGSGFLGSGRNRSAWRPGTPPAGRPAISAREDAMLRPH